MHLRRDPFDRLFIAAAAFTVLSGCDASGCDALGHKEIALPEGLSLGTGNSPANPAPAAPNPAPAAPDPVSRSRRPTPFEWNGGSEVTVGHASSLGCVTKMVREWLQMNCSRTVVGRSPTGMQVIRPRGDGEIYTSLSAYRSELVLPVRPGVDTEVRFLWEGWGSRTLSVNWPNGGPSASMSFDQGAGN